MKHQQIITINKGLVFISFILLCLFSNAQSLVSFDCEEETEHISIKLRALTPFMLKTDTSDKEIERIENTLYFIKGDSILKCLSYGEAIECLDAVYKVKYKNTNVYIVDFYELLVGYSYCIIVREDLLEVFITDMYNLNEELYQLDYNSIDFSSNSITTLINKDTGDKKQVYFKKNHP